MQRALFEYYKYSVVLIDSLASKILVNVKKYEYTTISGFVYQT